MSARGDNLKKKVIIILATILISLLIVILYSYLRIKFAKIEVKLVSDLTLEFSEKKKVSDYIESINGTIINDYIIDSSELGTKKVEFKFKNNDNIKVKYQFEVNVVDTKEPLIWLGNTYKIEVGSEDNLTDIILCGDNYDSNPNCYIEGNYDLNTEGIYPLTFNAIDNSGNKESVNFNLNVYKKSETSEETIEPTYTNFSDIINKYKTENTKIGLDISSWQGEVDFQKLKDAGVEFVMIRLGGTKGTNAEYFMDKYFERNIKEANKYGIEAGIYFYSYANSVASAKKDAKWVIKQIKNYNIKLPVAFDWEEWKYFNEYNLSFFGLTNMADEFLKEIEKENYKGMLYSSKTYLENIWLETDYDIWLAHYTEKTNYQGKYKMWQLCDNGKIDGIDGPVDIDIMYK